MPSKNKGGGGRKIGRSKDECKQYLMSRRRIKNKKRKMLKRIKNIKEETQERIIKLNPIMRERERGE